MDGKHLLAISSAAVALGLSGAAYAEPTVADLQAKVDALQSRVAELEGRQSETWLNARRAEEVKALVREVLADADTRASLAETALTAGHDGNHFYLRSEDGTFSLNIAGRMQVRYLYDHRRGPSQAPGAVPEENDNESGFEITRANLYFMGTIGSPRLKYNLSTRLNRDTEIIDLDRAVISYDLMDGLTLWGGQDKAPFLREELTSASYQLAVERSLVNEIFTAARVQGIGVAWESVPGLLKLNGSFNDGMRSGEGAFDGAGNRFDNDATDFALDGRADLKLAGDWKQMEDFTAWSNEPFAAFLGAAIHFERGETGNEQLSFPPGSPFSYDQILMWTVDGSVEVNSFNIYGAFIGQHTEGSRDGGGNPGIASPDLNNYGALIQGGYNIADKVEPFVRYEWVHMDKRETLFGQQPNDLHLLTAGVNYFIAKHRAKFTLDVVWALEPVTEAATGGLIAPNGLSPSVSNITGLLPDAPGHDNQFVIRAQFQLLF